MTYRELFHIPGLVIAGFAGLLGLGLGAAPLVSEMAETSLLVGLQWALGASCLALTIADAIAAHRFSDKHLGLLTVGAAVFVVQWFVYAALAILLILLVLALFDGSLV